MPSFSCRFDTGTIVYNKLKRDTKTPLVITSIMFHMNGAHHYNVEDADGGSYSFYEEQLTDEFIPEYVDDDIESD